MINPSVDAVLEPTCDVARLLSAPRHWLAPPGAVVGQVAPNQRSISHREIEIGPGTSDLAGSHRAGQLVAARTIGPRRARHRPDAARRCPRPPRLPRSSATTGTATAGWPSSCTSVDDDAGLLGDLTTHRLLGGLPRLDEAGQCREPTRPATTAWRPSSARSLRVGDQDDHRRVDAGEVRRAVLADSAVRPPAALTSRGAAAARAVRVGGVPLGQGHRVAEPAGVVGRRPQRQLAQSPGVRRPGLGDRRTAKRAHCRRRRRRAGTARRPATCAGRPPQRRARSPGRPAPSLPTTTSGGPLRQPRHAASQPSSRRWSTAAVVHGGQRTQRRLCARHTG